MDAETALANIDATDDGRGKLRSEHRLETLGSMAEALHGLGGLSQVVLLGGGLLVAYAAAVVAAAEPKAKRG